MSSNLRLLYSLSRAVPKFAILIFDIFYIALEKVDKQANLARTNNDA